jgi:hypothetical protein
VAADHAVAVLDGHDDDRLDQADSALPEGFGEFGHVADVVTDAEWVPEQDTRVEVDQATLG